MGLGSESVTYHAVHIRLDDGFTLALHLVLHSHMTHLVVTHQVVFQAIHAYHALTVKLHHIAILAVLVHAVEIVDGPSLVGGRMEEVAAKSHIGLVITQIPQDGRHDVYLLGYGVAHTGLDVARGVIDDDGRAETADIRGELGVVAQIGVVRGDYKDGILEPRLLARRVKEAAQRIVGIAYALVYHDAFLGIFLLILVGYLIGVMARRSEEGGDKGLAELAHLGRIILHERLVPDSPVAVKVVVATVALVLVEILSGFW